MQGTIKKKRAAETPDVGTQKMTTAMQEDVMVERQLNRLVSTGWDDVGFGKLQCALLRGW